MSHYAPAPGAAAIPERDTSVDAASEPLAALRPWPALIRWPMFEVSASMNLMGWSWGTSTMGLYTSTHNDTYGGNIQAPTRPGVAAGHRSALSPQTARGELAPGGSESRGWLTRLAESGWAV